MEILSTEFVQTFFNPKIAGFLIFLERYVVTLAILEMLARYCPGSVLFSLALFYAPSGPSIYYSATKLLFRSKPPTWVVVVGCFIFIASLNNSYNMFTVYYLERYLRHLLLMVPRQPTTLVLEYPVESRPTIMILKERVECFICCEEYVDATKLKKCEHMFHTPCLFKWFSLANTCPICRSVSSMAV